MKLESITIETLTEIVHFLDEQQIRYVVFGALCPLILIDSKDPAGRGFGARETRDVDMLIEVDDWKHYDHLLELLDEKGFKRTDKNIEHQLTWKNQQVDLIPYGKNLIHEDQLIWPESGHKMDVSGFETIFEQAESVDLEDMSIRMIPLPLSLYTKTIAFSDRQFPRDLVDIAHILLHYEEIGFSERRYDTQVPEDLEYEFRGAYLLGADLKSILPKERIDKMAAFFKIIQKESLPALQEALRFHRLSYSDWNKLIDVLKKGLFN